MNLDNNVLQNAQTNRTHQSHCVRTPPLVYQRVYELRHREGIDVILKKVYRLFQEAGIDNRRFKRRKGKMAVRQPTVQPDSPNHTWSLVFKLDSLARGHIIKRLAIVDDFTKECLNTSVVTEISGEQIVRTLDGTAASRGYPKAVRTDHGLEFSGSEPDQWADRHGIELTKNLPQKIDVERLHRKLQQ